MQARWAAGRRPFVLDLRALALLRLGMAAVLLLDLAIRSTDLEVRYANLGVLPVPVLLGMHGLATQLVLPHEAVRRLVT